MKTLLSLVAVSFLALFTGCASTSHHTALEYRIIQGVPRQEEFQQKLNAAAAEGYSIHSSTFVPGDQNTQNQMILILKRRKP